ncbi:MAG: serine/threonine-protein phosphatase [Actinomycetota bacterium]|nr:serine/threonine-protein phosphatase [Actinomycetota bacterium]
MTESIGAVVGKHGVVAALDGVTTRMLDRSLHVSAEHLAVVLGQEVAAAGARDAVVYLQDFDHQTLLALSGGAPAGDRPIGSSGSGQSFRSDQIVQEPDGAGVRVWAPLRDGGERVGVLGLTLPGPLHGRDDEAAVWRLSRLVAALLVVKGAYSDVYFFARRRKPMALAAEMQWQLLPPLTLHAPQVSIAGMLSPAYEVGGDCFDYALNDHTLHFAIFDSMGHGLRAAILTAAVVGAYRHARRSRVGLRDKYAVVDDVVQSQFDEEHFVTAQMANLDVRSGVLRWVNAGHPRPLLVRHGRVAGSLRGAPTLPMGLGGEAPIVSEEQLQPGDRLVLFTDGVIEERTSAGIELGIEGLTSFLDRVSGLRLPVAKTVRLLSEDFQRNRDGSPADDSTVVLLEWHP